MENKCLVGKVALITGSSRGLGRAYAETLASEGAAIAIHARTNMSAAYFHEAESGEAVATDFLNRGIRVHFFTADIRKADQVERLIHDVVSYFGQLDIVVNNAGGDIGAHTPKPRSSSALEITEDDINSVVARNLIGTMLVCKYAGRYMKKKGEGKIINISSQAAHLAIPTQAVYAGAKAGIEQYTRCLAEELRPSNVHVNCLAVGGVYTGRILSFAKPADESNLAPLQRMHTKEDMAKLVLFLASPLSDALTGETIVCWGR